MLNTNPKLLLQTNVMETSKIYLTTYVTEFIIVEDVLL